MYSLHTELGQYILHLRRSSVSLPRMCCSFYQRSICTQKAYLKSTADWDGHHATGSRGVLHSISKNKRLLIEIRKRVCHLCALLIEQHHQVSLVCEVSLRQGQLAGGGGRGGGGCRLPRPRQHPASCHYPAPAAGGHADTHIPTRCTIN